MSSHGCVPDLGMPEKIAIASSIYINLFKVNRETQSTLLSLQTVYTQYVQGAFSNI